MRNETLKIDLVDTGDNHPISYSVSSRTTQGFTAAWHLVELLDNTFGNKLTFRYAMLDEFINALQKIKSHVEH